jgi:hypothetical protein
LNDDSLPRSRTRPLRFVFFGRSIVSDWENPTAHASRALLRSLNNLGHETRFLEQRGNQPTVDLLQAKGAGPLRAFSKQFPDIVYRTYELPNGTERTVWLAREVGDVDAVVALDDAPPEVLAELARVPLPRLVRVIALTTTVEPPFEPDILLGTDEMPLDLEALSDPTQAIMVARLFVSAVDEELKRRRSPSASTPLA